jgi:hypothetical protein
MAWQSDSTSGYRDFLNKIVQMATSKHVSAVAVNAGGSSYNVGDMLTVTHAGAAMDMTAEVLTLSGSAVATVKLRNMGAFSNRLSSAVVNAGGTGYAVGDILEVEGGTATQKAKVKVATLSGSAVATVTVQDGGGAYSVAPGLTGATTNNDPGSGSGTGCTLNLTMTSLIGTTGAATTTDGGGSGCTLNLTLTDTGWTCERDWNNFSYNSVTDEKEVVLSGTVASGDEPYIAFRSYTAADGGDTRYGLLLLGMTSFNSGLALSAQPNIGPSTGGTTAEPYTDDRAHITCLNTTEDIWFSFTGRKLAGVIKSVGVATTTYSPFYVGLGNPFGTVTENPYPMFISGTTAVNNTEPDDASYYVSSFINPIGPTSSISSATFFWRLSDSSWVEVRNGYGGAIANDAHTMYPVGETEDIDGSLELDNIVTTGAFAWFDGICDPKNATETRKFYRTPNTGGDIFLPVPVTLIRTPYGYDDTACDVHLELDNIFWVCGTLTSSTKITGEDTFTIGSDRYRVFRDCHNSNQYSYFCMKEA